MRDVVLEQFGRLAETYGQTSRWATDPVFADAIFAAVDPAPTDRVLEVGCGNGLLSARFKGRVGALVGVDCTPAMAEQARPHLDEVVIADAEDLPFAEDSFDHVYERQAIQFTHARRSVAEMVRVARPGGRIVLAQLCAYGLGDSAELFEILRLRNAARREYYLRENLLDLLTGAGCKQASMRAFVTDEAVEDWLAAPTIDAPARTEIRRRYADASRAFRTLHSLREVDGRTVDKVLFGIAIGVK